MVVYLGPGAPTQQLLGQVHQVEDGINSSLAAIINRYRPDLTSYENFYRNIHQDPELSGVEAKTAAVVATHLEGLGLVVHSNIGGHGVVGLLENGLGRAVLIRAELDALPRQEQTNLSYASTKIMTDRYGNERPVMHACGHDMNMAALLGATALLHSAREHWSGTLVVVFQPDEEETGGAKAMVEDGLYSMIPVPNIMLAQHVTPMKSGSVAIASGPMLMAADAVDVRVFGGPCPGINPQLCQDPIAIAMRIVQSLQDVVRKEFAEEEATVACWGFHAGIPGADFVFYADFLLDIKTAKPKVRDEVLVFVKKSIEAQCKEMDCPKDPLFTSRVRAPLTTNAESAVKPIREAFSSYFASNLLPMELQRATEDFSALQGSLEIPYAYWNFGGTSPSDEEIAYNHSPFYAPAIDPTLKCGIDAMALATLASFRSEGHTP